MSNHSVNCDSITHNPQIHAEMVQRNSSNACCKMQIHVTVLKKVDVKNLKKNRAIIHCGIYTSYHIFVKKIRQNLKIRQSIKIITLMARKLWKKIVTLFLYVHTCVKEFRKRGITLEPLSQASQQVCDNSYSSFGLDV